MEFNQCDKQMIRVMTIEPIDTQCAAEKSRRGTSAAVVIKMATLGLMLLFLHSGFLGRATFAQHGAGDISPALLSLVRGV